MRKPAHRILIADDDPIVRDFLRALLARIPQFQLVGEATDGDEAIEQVSRLKPDVLLLDLLLPSLPGIETLRELTTVTVPMKTILLCSAITERQVVEALQLGARGVVLKQDIIDLEAAITSVLNGDYWIHSKRVKNIVEELRAIAAQRPASLPGRDFGLTDREIDIVSLVVEGCPNKEIARRLQIAEDTVKRHLTNTFNKVGTSTRLELALFAVESRLIEGLRRSAEKPHH